MPCLESHNCPEISSLTLLNMQVTLTPKTSGRTPKHVNRAWLVKWLSNHFLESCDIKKNTFYSNLGHSSIPVRFSETFWTVLTRAYAEADVDRGASSKLQVSEASKLLGKKGQEKGGEFLKFLHQEILLLQWNFLGYCCSTTTEWPYFQGKLPVDFVVHRYVWRYPCWNKSNMTHPDLPAYCWKSRKMRTILFEDSRGVLWWTSISEEQLWSINCMVWQTST